MRPHTVFKFGLFLFGTLTAMAAGAAIATWPAAEQTEEDVIARSLASSVQLFAEREGGVRRTASGVTLTAGLDGRSIVITAAHLLMPQMTQTVYVAPLGGGTRVEARILAIDELYARFGRGEIDADRLDLAVGDADIHPLSHRAYR